jgi:small conductance mechanosensitive channel
MSNGSRTFGRAGMVLGLLATILIVVLSGGAAPAQSLLAAPSSAATSIAQPAASSPSTADLQQLVKTLQNDKDRLALIGQLQALIEAQQGVAKQQVAQSPATWLNDLSQRIDAISGEILATAVVIVDAPRLVGWVRGQIEDGETRDRWIAIGLKLAIIFGCALTAEWVLRRLLQRPALRLSRVRGRSVGTAARLLFLLLAVIVELAPLAVFIAVAYGVLPMTAPRFGTARVAEALIVANLWARGVLAIVRIILLSPNAEALYALGEETRQYLYIWARRLTGWAVYGYAVAGGAWWLGVPGAIYALILRGILLAIAILLVVFVLQNRGAVGLWIRGRGAEDDAGPTQDGSWRLLRNRLAETWHVLAIIYIASIFSVYIVHIENGLLSGLRTTLVSIVVVVAAILINNFARHVGRRGFAVSPELTLRFPTLEARANRYLPAITFIISFIVYLFAALALLQAWGVDAFAWIGSSTGSRVTGSATTIAIVVIAAILVWELFSAAIERYLLGLARTGAAAGRIARLRTLLPLIRTTVMVTIVTIVALIALAELGINIVPLLAGASIVGVAIAFGSQALVKDVITGLFILIEDTFSVGDIIDVGKGSGTIERISIRTIRLRDTAGNLQTIPFSEITTVRNMTRDFAYVVCDAGVLYREDPDRVMDVLREVGAALTADPAWAPLILEPLDIWGVDRFTDSAIVIRARLKVAPTKQWTVGREFNRRLKKAFDKSGIEMPSMNQTRYLEPPPEPAEAPAPADR